MPLFLIESPLKAASNDEVRQKLQVIAAEAQRNAGSVVEAQVAADLARVLVVIDAPDEAAAQQAVRRSELTITLCKQVRLIGQDLTTAKARKGVANYLVEWNFPPTLTMDAYLRRKAEKSPLYAQVPEVHFERTYVCEDMTKCLCFYDSEDEATVKRAREVVGAPIDVLARIDNVG